MSRWSDLCAPEGLWCTLQWQNHHLHCKRNKDIKSNMGSINNTVTKGFLWLRVKWLPSACSWRGLLWGIVPTGADVMGKLSHQCGAMRQSSSSLPRQLAPLTCCKGRGLAARYHLRGCGFFLRHRSHLDSIWGWRLSIAKEGRFQPLRASPGTSGGSLSTSQKQLLPCFGTCRWT